MPSTIRFPFARATRGLAAERDQIITLLENVGGFVKGGPPVYADVRAWKLNVADTSAPYHCVALEFYGNGEMLVGDGTQPIGLFGELDGIGKTLLGTGFLGSQLAGAYPQIPIIAADISYTQFVNNVALYDRLSIGGVLGDIDLDEGNTVTVIARPIHQRVYAG